MRDIIRIALDASWRIVGGARPITDDDRKVIGEATARSCEAAGWITKATYDHASRTVNVRFLGESDVVSFSVEPTS